MHEQWRCQYFFPGENMWIRTEEIQGVRRKYFASERTISRGGGKGMATAQTGQSAQPKVPCAGGVFALSWKGKEFMFITFPLLRYCQMCVFLCK